MSAMSALPMRKLKKQVYGKAHNRSDWNVDDFFDDNELVGLEPAYVAKHVLPTPTPASTAAKLETKKSEEKAVRPLPKRHDTFDVPSSDDEISSPVRTISTGFQVRSTLVDDTDSSVADLAPWERKRMQTHRLSPKVKNIRVAPASPEAQLQQDLERAATLSPERARTSSPSPKSTNAPRKGIVVITSPKREIASDGSSAAARLATRRKEEARPNAKRAALTADEPESTPRKRARTVTPSNEPELDIVMTDSIPELHCDMAPKTAEKREQDGDIYALPTSSDDDLTTSKPKPQPARPATNKSRRGKLKVYSSKPSTKKGISGPARLAEMLSTDTDTTEPPTRSPSVASRRSTPHQTPSTPPSGNAGSPETALRAKTAMTPKQAQLWSQLLPSDPIAPSPSALALKGLTISGSQPLGPNSATRRLIKAQSDVSNQRARLVDRLKASAPTSDDEVSEDESEEAAMEIANEEKAITKPERPETLDRKLSQTTQSQSQSASSGPRITYSSMRSFLPEDNPEQDFMAGLDEPMHDHVIPKPAVKSVSASQKSAFDFDDMGDEGAQAGIRTIHELRASGRTMSGMYDIEELLSEVQNHNASHRSRRRSALIELATKLVDKAFATRFIGQSLEAELAAECGADSDEIAEFVLAVIVALVLSSEPPEHTVRALYRQGVTKSLADLLDRDVDIVKLAKDRKSNMSKSSQTSLINFADMSKRLSSLWGEDLPNTPTTRLFALKALDLLASKLRRAGERSDLLDAARVELILPGVESGLTQENQTELALAISVLESLSTTPASLSWPSASIEKIAEILPRLNTDSSLLRHTFFLTLRLCLNLTNDNARNCELLSTGTVVPYLLTSIKEGFTNLESELEDEQRALALDLLVLGMGIMINLAEKCDTARQQAIKDEDAFSALIAIFQQGQKHMLDAESVEESVSNVAFGYLAVMLSNFCQNSGVKAVIASKLPGKNLSMLIEAIEEFVLHHQKVDMMNFEGEEGAEVWGAFTEKLKAVLARLKDAELNM